MSRSFYKDISDPDHFVITLELVPGSEYRGLALDAVTQIAKDAMADGRVSAVTITDNPGGNPSLSPDVKKGQRGFFRVVLFHPSNRPKRKLLHNISSCAKKSVPGQDLPSPRSVMTPENLRN